MPQTKGDGKFEVELSHVVSQVSKVTVPVLDEVSVKSAYLAYKKVFQRYPKADEELNNDQITALHYLLSTKSVPYVDFALYRPGAKRNVKKLRLEKMDMNKPRSKSPKLGLIVT